MARSALWLSLGALAAGGACLAWLSAHGLFQPARATPGDRPAEARAVAVDRPFTIALFGASLMARGDWKAGLERRLAACRPGRLALRVVARPGASSDWGLKMLEALDGADAVVVDFAVNDASLWRG
ncbi:MAG: hypothetical protein ACK5MQ_16950, partial [Pikeienuella sp.]